MAVEKAIAVSEALNRLCHALRTPLGIALSVLNDQVRGLPCSDGDFEHAQAALTKAKDLIAQAAKAAHCSQSAPPPLSYALNLVLEYFRQKGARCSVLRDDSIVIESAQIVLPSKPCRLLEYALSDYTIEAIKLITASSIFAAHGKAANLRSAANSLKICLIDEDPKRPIPSAASKLKRRSVLRHQGSSRRRSP